ncbi:MAG: fused MFS/spermidine synthase [Pontiellaceae bacterium]|nr:fused MFS/spermidine synthase [Pontiellaceae bacterium]
MGMNKEKSLGAVPSHRKMSVESVAIVLVACICGWFMMQLEILGVRILVPHFGSSVYVSGSVIGVFLLSLSVGYMLGGWLSSRRDAWIMLGSAMLAVGIWKCLIPLIDKPLCDSIFNTGVNEKWGSLLASLALFGFPTVLLGTISPVVVHWLTTRTGQSGFSAGLVLATSTMASFAGCLVTAFYLVELSLRDTLYVSGGIMVVLGCVALVVAAIRSRMVRVGNKGVEQ